MVSYATSSLIFVAVIFSVISYSFQIKCFVCRNFDTNDLREDPNFPQTQCPTTWTTENMTDCPTKATQCLKIDTYISDASGVATLRLCDTDLPQESCGISNADFIQCYYCNIDGCNADIDIYPHSGGSYNGITFTAVLRILFSALFISKLV